MDDSRKLASSPSSAAATSRSSRHLDIKLTSGNLVNVAAPAYVLGVFDNINPTGATRFVDSMLGGTLMRLVQDRMLGSSLGQISILPTPRQRLAADMVIFAGLGPIDTFSPQVLEIVAGNLARVAVAAKLASLTVVPVGANAGLAPEHSIASFLAGFLRGLSDSDPGHEFQMVQFCEFDTDRYEKVKDGLRALEAQGFFRDRKVEVTVREAWVDAHPATSAAPPPEKQIDPIYLQVRTRSEGETTHIDYTVLTADSSATIETHTRTITMHDRKIAGEKLARAKTIDEELGAALIKYYMPVETQQLILHQLDQEPDRPVVVLHDKSSSTIPWEALHFGSCCPAVRAGLSRRFLSSNPGSRARSNLPAGTTLRVLLVANPTGDLPAAGSEGKFLGDLFSSNKCAVTPLTEREATKGNLLKELSSGEYDILHYAGHADFVDEDPGQSGLLCHDGRLSGTEIARAVSAPQLVFLNGCESVRMRDGRAGNGAAPPRPRTIHERLYVDLPESVTLAESMLLGGVSNLIGTYWPVNDAAAGKFAATFYNGLLGGDPLGLALRNARQEILLLTARDWANYQHFGNPSYRLRLR